MLKIQKILYIINFLIFLSKQDIIKNPFLVTTHGNPIFLQNTNNYFIYTSGELVIINRATGEISGTSAFGTYGNPYIWITDESNKYYIYASDVMYNVLIPSSYSQVTKPSIQYPTNSVFIGYMKETKFENENDYIGCLAPVEENEIIIYGKSGTSKIILSFLKKAVAYSLELSNSFEDRMSCKVIANSQYICAIITSNKVYILVFAHVVKSKAYKTYEMKLVNTITFGDLLSSHTNINLYDMNNPTIKLACAMNINTNYMECLYFITTFTNSVILAVCNNGASISMSQIIMSFPVDPNSNGECVLTGFFSEYLTCCAGKDMIKCSRCKTDFSYIDTFDLNFPGENSKLSIFPSGSIYSSIFFLNENSGERVYKYTIYPPTCKNLNFTIIVHHSINENNDGNEFDLSTIFTRKTNTIYYFEFETIPEDYGDLLINNETIIMGNNSKFILEENTSYILDFISNKDNVVDNFEIPYKISIEETYSASCTMNLTILPCYDSCSRCSKDKSSSSPENHNCYEDKCKLGYYPGPIISTNCFTEDEKDPHWFLDYNTMRFAICHNNCSTCYDSAPDNCVTCYPNSEKPDLSYFLNNKCTNQCPEGTFRDIQNEGYYKCKNCFQSCKTCTQAGNSFAMLCDSCNENNIKYSTNCYKEYDSKEKTFYKPESATEITSCKELLGLYIEADTYECVNSMPSTGYFLVNTTTGLFAKCHSDCKTCSRNYTEISSNCDTCVNSEYYLLDGNCIETCPEGYYSTVSGSIKICKKCYTYCKSCNSGAVYDNLNKLTNMNCLTCAKGEDPNDSNNLIENKIQIESNCFPIMTYTEEKITFDISKLGTGETEKSSLDYSKVILYGTYKCITKQDNYFYVLNTDENTGVVKQCDISCATCNGEKNAITQDTNCITCAEGYYKTQDSNTNCILESLIPENYFRNNSDNIYYKCYIYCKKCNNYYIAETDNMNCVECITDYYFVYGTNNCYEMSYKDENDYFFSERDNKFHKCYFSCLKCSQLELDEYNHNCDECISGFYFEYNTKNCYNMSVLERGYYFDDFSINEGEDPVFKKCYENCKTCNDTMVGNNMNCILCKDDFYKMNGTNNCYDDSLIDQGYYLKEDIFYPCEENCKTCSNSKTTTNNIISNNCLSCDFATKGLYLVSDLNNCELESFKENGYYLKEKEDDHNTKIFYKCYLSCSLCDKEKEFDSLTNQDNHNCLKCSENYYPLKNDKNPKNCYNEEEMAPRSYILVRNYWQFCHENCEDCNVRPDYDEKNKLISQNCISCYGNFHFIYNTKDCYDDSILEKGYYLDDNDLMYHKCDIQCKTCEKYSTSSNPKCTKCNSDSGYYLAYNKPTSNCYNQTTIEKGYILSTIEDPITGETFKKWMICYKTCKTCKDYGDDTENNCLSCISRYYLIYGTNNCLRTDEAENKGYYFNTTYGQYVKCDKACLTCTNGLDGDNTNCKKCNEKEGYYPIKGRGNTRCYSKETIGEGYFFNNAQEPYVWEECYEYCSSCNYKGNKNRMACLSCRTDIINKEYNKTIYLKLSNGNCKIGCPPNLFLTKQLDCVKSCLNETYEYIPNVTCVDTCPENYILNPERTRCVFSSFSGSTSPSEFRDILFSNLSSFVDSDTVINATNFKAQIISSSDIDPIEQIKNGISGLDFGDCIQTLKNKYNIPENEDLIVIEIETKEDQETNKDLNYEKDCVDLGKNVKVSICDKFGNILDMSYCNNEITVMKYVGDVDNIDLNTAMDYAEQGIDVFNAQDSFFNDRCHHFRSDQDVILGDRRDDFYQNVSFCDEGCTYNGMDFNYMIAKCSCDAGSMQDENVNLDELDPEAKKGITLNDLANSFTSDLFSFNFDVIKCYNLVFNLEILKQNKGFFSFVVMIGLQLILLIYFSIKKLKPIRNYMLVFEPFNPRIDPPNPPKHNTKTEHSLKKKLNIYNLLNPDNDNNKNLSKKEQELRKSILISHLLNKDKFKKKDKEEKEKDNDDALVVHYENSDDSSDVKSYEKKQKDSEYSKSSGSYSEYKRKKEQSIINYLNYHNQVQKLKKEENNEESNQNSKSINSKKKKNKIPSLKIYNRNNKSLNSKHIFSKETILGEKTKNNNQKKTLTLESNDSIEFNELKNYGSFGNIKRYSLGRNYSKGKNNDSIKEKYKEEDEKNLSKINSENTESDHDDNKNIKLSRKKRRKLKNGNKRTLKYALRKQPRNINIITSKDGLYTKDQMKHLKESNSVKYYRKNKFDKNIISTKKMNDMAIPEATKKTESELNKKDENIGNMRLKYKKVNYSYTREELNDMEFDLALSADNRSFCSIYLSYLLEEHIIFNTFFTDLYLELRSIKMSFLLFGIQINFFLNALFYTDEYISDTYHNDGVLDFFSSLPKSIYSFIVTLIISGLLKILSSSKKQLNKIIEEKEDKEEYLAAVDNELNKLRKKLAWFFIIVFILGIFFAYYCAAFCAVYSNSQKFWLIGCLESVALDFMTPFVICFVLASLRFIGLKKRIKCFYNAAKYLGIIM